MYDDQSFATPSPIRVTILAASRGVDIRKRIQTSPRIISKIDTILYRLPGKVITDCLARNSTGWTGIGTVGNSALQCD